MTTFNPESFVVTFTRGTSAGTAGDEITLSGWSDNAAVVGRADVSLYSNVREGVDGTLEGTVRGKFGADVPYEFMSSSPMVPWLLEVWQDLANGIDTKLFGTQVNLVTNHAMNMRNGLLITAPPIHGFGTDGATVMPFTIRWQELVPVTAGFRSAGDNA